ncbi:low molecular weight protein-tyrosine-phosphatase [Tessaracoccus palaemonis]|uniref:protein-tyrosine-phosphatase n=1 Tax=Tessaracoccus palaemonis TaxID=2829499 RepID=A0ABX8SPG3_9ACTN|nr:low molecular weight protein-tyrosine-phosphatase [Tessaracoccus palaemonis]QXT63104.1 low molecular weight phosphotyrosine protein phosphatase [Tessaracoccus palaemonis]
MTKLVFVCWGNICRSPMAERVAEKLIDEQGLDVEVSSFGISDEEHGNPIDVRAVRVLRGAGYRADDHGARQVTAADLRDADLVIAVEPFQVARLRGLAPGVTVELLNDYNPEKKGEPLDDPWYGGPAGFESTLSDIEAAMPGILEAVTAEWDPATPA